MYRHHRFMLCPPHTTMKRSNVAVAQVRFTVFPLCLKYLVLLAPVTHCATTIYYVRRFLVIQCTLEVSTRQSFALVFRVDTTPVCNRLVVFVRPIVRSFWIFPPKTTTRSLIKYYPYHLLTIRKNGHEFWRFILKILCLNPHKWYLRPISTTIRARPFAVIVWTPLVRVLVAGKSCSWTPATAFTPR